MFNVGDTVICHTHFYGDIVGSVKRITPTGKIVVDYGTHKTTYRPDGWQAGSGSVWNKGYIRLATEEDLQKIQDRKTVAKCKKLFESTTITADKAKRIIEILKEQNE